MSSHCVSAAFLGYTSLSLICVVQLRSEAATTVDNDALNRVASVVLGSHARHTYAHDPSGNRTNLSVVVGFSVRGFPSQHIVSGAPLSLPLATAGLLPTASAEWTVRSSNHEVLPMSGMLVAGAGTSSPVLRIASASGATGTTRITIVASDGSVASATSFALAVGANRSPLAINDSAQHPPGLGTKIERNKLLANDSDPDRDPISLASVVQVSAHGGQVRIFGPFVAYEPPEGYDGPDFFSYTISDSHGATANAAVFVRGQTVAQTVPITVVGSELLSNGHRLVSFIGLPNAAYEIQVSLDLTTWSVAGVVYSDSRGSYHYEDVEAEVYPARFYRAVFR